MFTETYDYVFSLGEDCSAAMHLRKTGLRDVSSPFDWLCNASWETRIEMICNGFSGFLRKENLTWYPLPKEGQLADRENDIYKDHVTGFNFYHDFRRGVPLDDAYPDVLGKYKRRISRMYARLEQSQRAMLVWWSRDRRLSDLQLEWAVKCLNKRFPAVDIRILAFENDCNVRPGKVRQETVSPTVTRIVGGICPKLGDTYGHRRATDRILKKVRVSYPRQFDRRGNFLRRLIRVLSCLHFTHAGRARARDRWRQRLGGVAEMNCRQVGLRMEMSFSQK